MTNQEMPDYLKPINQQDALNDFWKTVNSITNDYAVAHCIVPPDAYKPAEKPNRQSMLKAFMDEVSGGFSLGSATPKYIDGIGFHDFIMVCPIIDLHVVKDNYQLSIKDITILETPDLHLIIQTINNIVNLNPDEFEND